MSAPRDLRYTKSHEWVRIEGDLVTMGLTDYAQGELGDITYLELPDVGDEVTQAEPLGVVESVKAASDIYAPVSGEVIERNEEVIGAPEIVNQSPYEAAWLVRIKMSDTSTVDGLMDPDEYDTFAEEAAQ